MACIAPYWLDTQKKSFSYREADRSRQAVFNWLKAQREGEVGADQIVYLDETGIDEREQYAYGWSKRGERCEAKRSGGHGKRLSLIAAIRGNEPQQLIEPYIFSGHCDRALVEVWLERLCQALPAGRKHYLILDNASFHKGGSLEEYA